MYILAETIKYLAKQRKERNGDYNAFNSMDRLALQRIDHSVSADQWSKDLHDILAVLRKNQVIQQRTLDRIEFHNERMVEHFGKMECVRKYDTNE